MREKENTMQKTSTIVGVAAAAYFVATIPAFSDFALPPSKPAAAKSSNGGGKGGGKGGAGKAVATGQLAANACATIKIAGDALMLERRTVWKKVKGKQKYVLVPAPRELTPLEASDDAAMCGSFAGMFVSLVSRVQGLKDSACNIAVAEEAYQVNNTQLAIEQRAFARDGSSSTWNQIQGSLHEKHVACYLGKKSKKPKKSAPLTS